MSKSILVVDTIKNCNECPLFTISSDSVNTFCVGFKGERKEIGVYSPSLSKKPGWCPLKDIPGKKKENKYHNIYEKGFADGFNACIDEILKGADGNE